MGSMNTSQADLLKKHVTAFCHRNMTAFSHDADKGLWLVQADEVPISLQLSRDGMIVTVFTRVSEALSVSREVEHALFEKLLRINLTLIGPSFALSPSGEVFLTYSRSLEDLDYNELAYLIVATKSTCRKYSELIGRVADLTSPAASGAGQTLLTSHQEQRGPLRDLTQERHEREDELAGCMAEEPPVCEQEEVDYSPEAEKETAEPVSEEISDFADQWDFFPGDETDEPVAGDGNAPPLDDSENSDQIRRDSPAQPEPAPEKTGGGDEWDFGI